MHNKSLCSTAKWSNRAGCLGIRCLLFIFVGTFSNLTSWLYISGFLFIHVFAMESCSVAHAGVQCYDFSSPQPSPSGLKWFLCLSLFTGAWQHAQLIFIFLVEIAFHHVGQAGLELLTSGDLPVLASQCTGITGVSHYAQPEHIWLLIKALKEEPVQGRHMIAIGWW